MDHATVVVSGTKIADEIGTSRSEVWRLVQQLRTLGVEIAGHPATGYQLKSVPDLLLPDMLAPPLKGTIFGADVIALSSLLQDRLDQRCGHGSGERGRAGRQRFRGRRANCRARARRASLAFGGFGGDLLFGGSASGVAAVGGAGAFAGCGTGGAFGGAADRLQSPARSEVAQRSADRWQEVLRHSDRDECGSHARPLHCGRHRDQREPGEFPAELQPIATSLRLASGTEWSRVELCAALLKSLDREYRDLLEKPDARESILRRFQERSSWREDGGCRSKRMVVLKE